MMLLLGDMMLHLLYAEYKVDDVDNESLIVCVSHTISVL